MPAEISIHALRVEGDLFALLLHSKSAEISIHALRVEGDILRLLLSSCTAYFYPRPPGGGRQPMIANAGRTPKISIHALRVEGDIQLFKLRQIGVDVCPRPPGGGRPHFSSSATSSYSDFYPRPPGGGRHLGGDIGVMIIEFLSTPSGWRATAPFFALCSICRFLSTPSGWRATTLSAPRSCRSQNFYPRPPGGGRPPASAASQNRWNFYPRPPGGGRRYAATSAAACSRRFLSTPSGWRATEP